ncbi:putative Molybdate-anion transporter [Seiridium unicorne]|uniref:Molybdate-anion transporter n=1 Tax=Seiridium unicorne TaxID=138068 RepID=A0ABR2UZA3_9PEZI
MEVAYLKNFVGLAALSSVLLVAQPTRQTMLRAMASKIKKADPNAKIPPFSKNHPQLRIYKVFFTMVVAAWLQVMVSGRHDCFPPANNDLKEIFIHNLYKKDYNLPDETIFQLTLTNFATSGLVSLYIGAFADRFGRKSTNVLFTACYGAAACLAMVPEIPALFAGRFLGGIAQAIMFSVLDSWIVGDFFTRKLITQGCDLYRTFGTLGVINSFAAVACGVLGDRLIWATGSNKAPFVLSWLVMWQAMQAVWSKMREAYGAVSTDDMELKKNTPTLSAFYRRPYIWALTFSAMVFEGSAFLFAFSAIPVLKSVHKAKTELPTTYLFACIMTSALVGSLSFNILMVSRKVRFVRLMSFILLGANIVCYHLARPRTERRTFWLSNAFGLLIGFYYPCMGTLKARLVDEGIRSTIFSLLRAPIYLYVVAQLLLNQDAPTTARLFQSSAWWFTASFGVMWLVSFHKKLP